MKYIATGLLAAGLALPAFGQAVTPAPSSAGQAGTIQAQPAAVQPQTAAVLEPAAQQNIMRAGTEVPLVMREELTTMKKQLRIGQRFQMEVVSNVEVNGVVIIPAGTPATGEITEVRNKGMWGKSGYINARVISLRMGDRLIRLSGTFDDKGVTGTGAVVGAVVLLPLAGFFMTGTSAMIPTGSAVKAFLEEDIAFRPIMAQPQVIDVPVAVPAPAVPAPAAPAPAAVAPSAASAGVSATH